MGDEHVPGRSINALRLSTDAAAPDHRVDFWRETVSRLLHPQAFEPIGPASEFEADFVGIRGLSTGAAVGSQGPSRTMVDNKHAADVDPGRIGIYVHRGKPGLHTARGVTRTLRAGEVLIERSDEPRTYVRPSTDRMVVLDLDVSHLSLAPRELRRIAFTPFALPSTMTRLLWSAPATVTDPAVVDVAAVDSYLVGVVDFLTRSIVGRNPDHAGTAAVRRGHALDFMRAHLADSSLTADSVARALGITRRRLYQLFPDTPPMEYLLDLRLARAVGILRDSPATDATISEIASRCGFASARSFHRAFLRRYSTTPNSYRAQPEMHR